MTSRSRLRILAALVGLVAPVTLGTLAGAADAVPAAASSATAAKAPVYPRVIALVNKKEVKKGKKVTITGHIEAPEHPECYAGVTLTVQRSTSGAVYKNLGTITADGNGQFKVKQVVTKKSRFRISLPANGECVESQSPPRTVDVIK